MREIKKRNKRKKSIRKERERERGVALIMFGLVYLFDGISNTYGVFNVKIRCLILIEKMKRQRDRERETEKKRKKEVRKRRERERGEREREGKMISFGLVRLG